MEKEIEKKLQQAFTLSQAITIIATTETVQPDPEIIGDLGRILSGLIKQATTMFENTSQPP